VFVAFGVERDSLWRKVVVTINGLNLYWDLVEVRDGFGTGFWKSFTFQGKPDFWRFIRFYLGFGEEIRFW